MNRILTCPHCGPTLTEARLRCDRCGRELVYVSEAEFTGLGKTAEEPREKSSAARRVGLWIGVAAAAVVVVAMAGLTLPRGAATTAAPETAAVAMAAHPPSLLPTGSRGPAKGTESSVPEAATAVTRPGDLGQALEQYRAALAEKPADPELLGNVGQILVAMNRPAEAVPFLEQAVQAEPFSIVARFDLAVAYGRSGRLREAVEQYEALAQAGSVDARVYHNLGLALRQSGRNADAVAAFERATALDPARAPGWMGLALSLEADGRATEAATALERFLVLEPAAADADNVRARIARLRAATAAAEGQPEAGSAASRR